MFSFRNYDDFLREVIDVVYDEDHEFVQDGFSANLSKDEIHQERFEFYKSIPVGSAGGTTWKSAVVRQDFDLVANWLHKELKRCGAKGRDSERRLALYRQRRDMFNETDMKDLWETAPSICQISGHPINYGLGHCKSLMNSYFMKKYKINGISPSIERIDSDEGYTRENIEIISAFENVGRNNGVDTFRLKSQFNGNFDDWPTFTYKIQQSYS